jgi:hypothetical protein
LIKFGDQFHTSDLSSMTTTMDVSQGNSRWIFFCVKPIAFLMSVCIKHSAAQWTKASILTATFVPRKNSFSKNRSIGINLSRDSFSVIPRAHGVYMKFVLLGDLSQELLQLWSQFDVIYERTSRQNKLSNVLCASIESQYNEPSHKTLYLACVANSLWWQDDSHCFHLSSIRLR